MEKFNNHVNVAKSRLSVGYTQNDESFLALWEKNAVFENTNKTKTGEKFVLLDGPPYANGDAHMGHALNKLLKDLVVKSQWFLGRSVDYRPGWDCHGLPLELAVEKKYGKLPSTTLKKRCKQLAFRSLVKQRRSFKRLGVLGQWNKPYVTLSQDMLENSWATVKKLFDKNLLEYKQFPVHYCPACASSLAEAELETKALKKDSLYFKMPLSQDNNKNQATFNDGKNHALLVWTTTPWTLPMNQAVAYREDFVYEVWSNHTDTLYLQNPNDVRDYLDAHNMVFSHETTGAFFNTSQALSPLSQNTVPMLKADFVEEGKTGFVHMSLAHGPEDFELGSKNGLKPVTYLNENGVFHNTFEVLNGKKHTQVQALVCEMLGDLLVDYQSEEVEQQVCWRHKCGVYYNATWQVFLKLEAEHDNLKQQVKDLLLSSSLSEHYKMRLEQMLLSRAAWCLSRQREWGCPMNLLVDKVTRKLNPLTSEFLAFYANNQPELAQSLLEANPHLEVFTDVLDVWFDSGNVVNEYAQTHGVNERHVVNLVLEGKDQFRGWFQSLLWLSVAVNGVMPYENLLCHGFVLDEQRKKFSKSAGNGSLVESYASTYGADLLHLWVASQEPENDAVFSNQKLEEMKRYYSRLRLSLRFMTSNLYDYDYQNHQSNFNQYQNSALFDVHLYMCDEMKKLHMQLKDYFLHYQFKKALEALYQFCDKTLSNFYFDYVKNPLYLRNSEERVLVQTALYELLMGLFDMVKVFCPFVAEEFYQDYFGEGSVFYDKTMLHVVPEYTARYDWQNMSELRKLVQQQLEPMQKEKVVKARTEVAAHLYVTNLEQMQEMAQCYRLGEVFGVSDVYLYHANSERVVLEDLKQNTLYHKCPRCWNYELFSGFVEVAEDYRVCDKCEVEMPKTSV